MYQVKVFHSGSGTLVEEKEFKFGDWQKIGFWLDESYYNGKRFHLEIRFIEPY